MSPKSRSSHSTAYSTVSPVAGARPVESTKALHRPLAPGSFSAHRPCWPACAQCLLLSRARP
eukprot:15354175-Heterocapsa_arctica.AAC.1